MLNNQTNLSCLLSIDMLFYATHKEAYFLCTKYFKEVYEK